MITACRTAMLVVALLSSACGSPEVRGGKAANFPATAPLDGTILYAEPVPQQGLSKVKTMPVFQVYTTASDEALAEEHPVHTFTGTIEGVGQGDAVSDREMRQAIARMLRKTQAGSRRVLTPQKFQLLWSALETTGLFQLPVTKGTERPKDEPYFLLRTGAQTWIFKRPVLSRPLTAVPPRGADPAKVSPELPQVQIWRDATLAFFRFVDSQ